MTQKTNKRDLLADVRNGVNLKLDEKIKLVLALSFPAIMAQISTIIMEYIDASMVGSLGANASAAIGVVSTTTWLVGGLCTSIGIGFTVGVAHKVGANEDEDARRYVKTGLLTVLSFSFLLMALAVLVHKALPGWMGADESIIKDASLYFLYFGLTLPLMQINHTGAGMLECSGNMKVPSILNVAMCFLDVLFNAFFIYPTREIALTWPVSVNFTMPGAGLGVAGAAIGTMCAEACGAVATLIFLLVVSDKLHLRKHEHKLLNKEEWFGALKISLPVMLSSAVMGSAYVVSTKIVSPLGKIAISANSFAITAESLCYMPGYGISHAATTLVGQAKGAKRRELEFSFAHLAIAIGMILMAGTSVLMFIFAPEMIGIMSPVQEIRELGTKILRIEAFAEIMFGASIVTEGVFRGMGRTRISTALNLISMWLVRLPLSAFAASRYGLTGVWYVMCLELCFRGLIFLISLYWIQKKGR